MADKEHISEHKVCKYQYYWNDDEGCDGWMCWNPELKDYRDCPHFPSETYNCKFYVEGDNYEY